MTELEKLKKVWEESALAEAIAEEAAEKERRRREEEVENVAWKATEAWIIASAAFEEAVLVAWKRHRVQEKAKKALEKAKEALEKEYYEAQEAKKIII